MAQFSIQPDNVLRLSDDEKNYISKLNQIESTIQEVKNSLRWKIQAEAGIAESLRRTANHAGNCSRSMGNMQKGLVDVVSKYTTTEQRIVGNGVLVNTSNSINSENGENTGGFPFKWDDVPEILRDLISSFGLVGSTVDFLAKVLTGGYPVSKVKTWADRFKLGNNILNDVNGLASNVLDFISGDSKTVAGAFGISELEKKSFAQLFEDGFDDYNLGKATKISEKMKVGAKWIGVATTAIPEGFENYEDNKGETDKTRWIKEMFGETAVNILEDMAISAGVGAAIGSVAPGIGTVAGAAVSVVGTVVVKWGINKGFEALTGQKIDEVISDVIIDANEHNYKAVVDTLGNVASTTGANVVKGIEHVTSWWNQLTGWGNTAFA